MTGAAPVPPPGSPPPTRPDAGRVVGGTVTAISADEVELRLDDGRPAVISRRNFDRVDTDPSSVYSVGDRVEGAILTRDDPRDRVVLSRAWALKRRAWEAVLEAAEATTPITGTVRSVSKKGAVVDVGVRGFVPMAHLTLDPTGSDVGEIVGRSLEFRILDVDPTRDRLVLSRRSALLREQRRETSEMLAGLAAGDVRTGRVESLVDYGAFVDLGGVSGLVHLSELSWQRVRHPSEMLAVGDEVEVEVLDVKTQKRRVSLSIRRLTDDPLAGLEVGAVVEGTVRRLVDFGAFVDLGGVEGLVHLTELAEHRVSAPEEIVVPGEQIRVRVLSVDRRRRRIELSIRQAVSDTW